MVQTKYFLGANSPAGFYSLYHQLTDPARMEALYILKGGPGCGKSTLMKRIASHAQAEGLDTQLILCSGDPDSLDGVVLPQKGIAVVDGTAPHVIEANCPGAVDTYVDLSRFYDHDALQSVKEELISTAVEYKGRYQQAYRSLGAAGELRRTLTEQSEHPELRQKLEKRAAGIIGRELKKSAPQEEAAEQRFLSALTHRGFVHLWDTARVQAERVYELSDRHGLAHHMLSPILDAAREGGHQIIACPDPMAPHRLAHLILPRLSLAFVTSTPDAPWPHRPYRHLRLDAMAEDYLRSTEKPRMRFTTRVAEALTQDGISALAQAKEAHDRLEALYNPHVDFDGVLALADRMAEHIIG